MKKTILLLTALFALAAAPVQAQLSYSETNNLFYHSQRVPQSNMLNPALFPTNNTFYLQLPSTTFLFGFPLSARDIVHYDAEQDVNVIDLDRMLDNLSSDNPFRLGFDLGVLGFGFKVGNLFFDFNTQLKTNFTFGLTGTVVSAMLNGNMDSEGNAIKEMTLLNGNLFNTQAYLETSIGAGYHIDPINLTVGVHAKLLSGIFNIQTDNTKVYIETDEDFNKVTVHAYYEAMESAAIPIDTANGLSNLGDHVGDIISNVFNPFSGNTGVAFDLGVKYDMGPFSFSASINDLSAGIHWQKNLNTVSPVGGEGVFEFSGIQINNLINNGNLNTDSLSILLKEKLNGIMPEFKASDKDYWYCVPTKVNLAANFNFAKILRAGLLLHGQFDRGLLSKKNMTSLDLGDNVMQTFRFNTTATLGLNLFNWAELIVGSSLVFDGKKADFFNPGVGLVLTPGTVFQTYIMADYVSSIYLTDVKAVNLKFGINMLIGNGGRKHILDN